jgi:hypothetical protein
MHQLDGSWKTKSLNLMELRDRVEHLMTQMRSVELVWQPRNESVRILGH